MSLVTKVWDSIRSAYTRQIATELNAYGEFYDPGLLLRLIALVLNDCRVHYVHVHASKQQSPHGSGSGTGAISSRRFD